MKLKDPQMDSTQGDLKRYIIIKFSKGKDRRDFEGSNKEKTYHTQGNPSKIISRFLSSNFEPRREWDDIFKMFKEKNCQQNYLPSKAVLRK